MRKGEAARVADRVLNESIVTTNWDRAISGTVMDNGHTFRWTLRNQFWPVDSSMQLLTAQVEFTAQGRNYSVQLSTLANSQTLTAPTGIQ